MKYQKYYGWIGHQKFRRVRDDLEKEGVHLIQETRIPCRILRPSIQIGFVAPSAWGGFCKRRISWYWKSERAEKFLIVSNTALDLPSIEDRSIITKSNFRLDQYPTAEEIASLIQSEEYQKKKPSEWDNPEPVEKDFYQKWFERHRVNEAFDFEKTLMFHSANHANFFDTKFFVIEGDKKIPYSISDTVHICSSCLEFFDILGSQWSVKYVVPCIGAVQFAHLPMDQYFRVENLNPPYTL